MFKVGDKIIAVDVPDGYRSYNGVEAVVTKVYSSGYYIDVRFIDHIEGKDIARESKASMWELIGDGDLFD